MHFNSAGGLVALLEQPHYQMNSFALHRLLSPYLSDTTVTGTLQIMRDHPVSVIDVFWAEVSDSIGTIEKLYESDTFQDRHTAALVASRIHYHLGSYDDAMFYALAAKEKFDFNEKSEYVDTIVAKCIDTYISKRNSGEPDIDPALETVVAKMLERCFADGKFEQAIGIAVEAKRLDVFSSAIERSTDKATMLSYAFSVCMNLVNSRVYRAKLLRQLVQLYTQQLEKPDYVQMCQCLLFLDDPAAVAEILTSLYQGSEEQCLMAYQIAFDMYESATQQFLIQVLESVRKSAPLPDLVSPELDDVIVSAQTKAEDTDIKTVESAAPGLADLSESDALLQTRTSKLAQILSGNMTVYLHLQFLMRHDKADIGILKQTKDAVRVSICHTATVMANALMHAGTTHDSFFRTNLDWLGRATNWAKLASTASLGLIHRGHEDSSMALMQSYLPARDESSGSTSTSGYAEGGALYALGLIHANHGGSGSSPIIDYLIQQIGDNSGTGPNEPIRHGGCLGLGLAAMGTNRTDVYSTLRGNLFLDDAVVGEAAGIAMGLVQVCAPFTADEQSNRTTLTTAVEDMRSYAMETQHEKIVRGLAVGLGMTMLGKLEEAEPLISSLTSVAESSDSSSGGQHASILRRAAVHAIGMAYCGTSSNKAIKRLLNIAVSDVNDDVRRAAVISIGFVLLKSRDDSSTNTSDVCPSVVSLLAESYNPHVRYGAAMAVGVACAGSGSKEAMNLLEPLYRDQVNFVRQGALLASALVLIQQTEGTCGQKVSEFRSRLAKVIVDKHEDVMVKFGAILSQGIIDAGGRNVTIALLSRTGHINSAAVVGMLVFTQYWFWFPLAHFLSLALVPTCVIALNSDLKMPVMAFKSKAPAGMYGYPSAIADKRRDSDSQRVATAVLSVTAKAHQRKREIERKKKRQQSLTGGNSVVEKIDESFASGVRTRQQQQKIAAATSAAVDTKPADTKRKSMDQDQDLSETADSSKKGFDILFNPARVMKAQLKVIELHDETATQVLTTDDKVDQDRKGKDEDDKKVANSNKKSSNKSKKESASSSTSNDTVNVITIEPSKNVYRPLKQLAIGGIVMMRNISDQPCQVVPSVSTVNANLGQLGSRGAQDQTAVVNDVEDEPQPPEPFAYHEDADGNEVVDDSEDTNVKEADVSKCAEKDSTSDDTMDE